MKLEKIEEKYLIPYLPYNLEFYNKDYKLRHFVNEILQISEYYSYYLNTNEIPIFRPLSDLTKGEFSLYGLTKSEILDSDVDYLPHGLVTYLLQNNYDIYKLIE